MHGERGSAPRRIPFGKPPGLRLEFEMSEVEFVFRSGRLSPLVAINGVREH